jgi:hypothetical protein
LWPEWSSFDSSQHLHPGGRPDPPDLRPQQPRQVPEHSESEAPEDCCGGGELVQQLETHGAGVDHGGEAALHQPAGAAGLSLPQPDEHCQPEHQQGECDADQGGAG